MDLGLGLRRRTEFHDDWISSRMEDSADSNPNSTTTVTVQVFRWMIDRAAHLDPNSTTTGFRWIRLADGLQRLPVSRRTEFDVDWISMECRLGGRRLGQIRWLLLFDSDDRLGRWLGPEFDDDWIRMDHS